MDDGTALKLREELSALADGELDGAALNRWMATPRPSNEELHAAWATYHLIGDVLREGEQGVGCASAGFLEKLQTRLQTEPPLVPNGPAVVAQGARVAVVVERAEAANDANFRWKMAAAFASFAAVVALTWGVVGGTAPDAAQPQLASTAPLAVPAPEAARPSLMASSQSGDQQLRLASGESQVMIRDARLDELLSAHRQTGGSTALHMPAGFLRSATFSNPER